MSTNPREFIGANGPPQRDWVDDKTDTGATAIYGVCVALEGREYDGNMALTGMTIDKALSLFLEDVAAESGPHMAAVYAQRLIDGLKRFVPNPTGHPTKSTPS